MRIVTTPCCDADHNGLPGDRKSGPRVVFGDAARTRELLSSAIFFALGDHALLITGATGLQIIHTNVTWITNSAVQALFGQYQPCG